MTEVKPAGLICSAPVFLPLLDGEGEFGKGDADLVASVATRHARCSLGLFALAEIFVKAAVAFNSVGFV